MPSRYNLGIEDFSSEERPNIPIFNDYEAIQDQLMKYYLMRERLRRRGIRGIRRKKRTPKPSHFTPNDRGEQGPLV